MVKVYADLIAKGAKSIQSVPSKIREDVVKELLSRGLDENGEKIVGKNEA